MNVVFCKYHKNYPRELLHSTVSDKFVNRINCCLFENNLSVPIIQNLLKSTFENLDINDL